MSDASLHTIALHQQPLRGRFAPSPTGRMHAGNIFASLIAWIMAKRSGGDMVLRIEDLDASRSRTEYADQLMRDLELLGLTWDDGPFYQHDRTEAYEAAFETLQEKAHVYPCFCTRADIASAAAPHDTHVYAGTCRSLTPNVQEERFKHLAAEKREPSWRLEMPAETVTFSDVFQGVCTFQLNRDCGDTILRRSDAGFAYQLAVVVDDAAHGITSVVRGCDLLSSTALQIHLHHLLEYPLPSYAHVPLLINEQGKRLAKRDKDASLDALLEHYKTPEALLGHIAALAGMIDSDEAISADQLLTTARLDALEGKEAIVWHGPFERT